MLDAEPMYNLKAVVQRTGIPAASLRAWERRYGILAPERKANGHRVYPASEILKLQRLKALMAQGMTISQAAEQVRSAAPVKPAEGSELDRIRQRLARALDRFDGHGAGRVMAEAVEMLPVEDFCLRVVRPLLPDLGPYGRTYFHLKLGALLIHAPIVPGARTALVLSPDPTAIESLLVAVLLSRRGHRVIYLEGSDVPGGLRPDLIIDPRSLEGRLTPDDYYHRLV